MQSLKMAKIIFKIFAIFQTPISQILSTYVNPQITTAHAIEFVYT